MTCAACAARIERKLNKLEGVDATVNYATERATVAFAPAVAPSDLVAAVEAAGYRALLPGRGGPARTRPAPGAASPSSAALTAPLVAALDDSAAPVRRLGVGCAGARDADRRLGRLAVPPGGAPERATRGGDDGHPDLDRHHRRVRVVGRRPRRRRRRGHVLRGRGCDHDADPPRPVPRGAGAAALGRGDSRAARSWARRRRVCCATGSRSSSRWKSSPSETVFVVRPGERIATDGAVEEGASAIDQSMLTGESLPVEVGPGAEVAGGTINSYGRLVVRATRVGAETALAQIARLVAEAQAGRGADPAARRPRLCGLRPGRARALARHARWLARAHRRRVRSASRRPSRC